METKKNENFIFQLDKSQCIGCGICEDVCVEGALKLGKNEIYPIWDKSKCIWCLTCEKECPTSAILINFRGEKL